ncbi:D-alanyl-D-alanine carboxypeptidase family protein [Clostridium aciditolerans]|uniref:D-alanyl-D-alanine carboxypeptidase family protein n=1 Tax=Clostridium aciditolerans TaxID=339861 RepID=A0A934M334_9CLOT|nr:D-alanyl-D-alanine carboxypeptidase family protein [Clostridium aciditolerans]MBI6871243.1 D-alanyl-D-alanine carboxypeptidase family protein [Clostridium aciditolerans]
MHQYNYWNYYYRATNYIVQPGDSLYLIAKRFNTTISDIKQANNLTSDLIYVGQSLVIPSPAVPTLPDGIYGIGSRGPAVVKIQQALSALGFNVAQDGIYGPKTSDIIMNLQKKFPEALTADGIYGPKTKMYLEKLLASKYKIVQNPESKTVLVNKMNSLSPYYEPQNLTVPNVSFAYPEYRPQKLMQPEAARALEALFAKAKQDNIALNAVSGYRSYDYQSQLFSRNIKANPNANQFSARPGESEHQTGLAMDVSSPSVNNNLTQAFGDTKEGKWLVENAPDFGFILRFPKGKENITGYQYEPWHIRYVGKDVARQIANQNITLEEYLGQST